MLDKFRSFADLSTPVKAGIFLASGGSLLGILYFFNPALIYVVMGGFFIVGVILFLYSRIVKVLKKRKASPLEQGLRQNTSATPQGITEASRMARLDDLRKKFEAGVETFKSAGKNLYDFPWYMIVGEPGSGKTEAIRHCNIGFPPGLQDEFQGAGGTLNMNWWFTDHAVILDTAGRLMFEELEAGQSSEWKEFLKLLKKSRNNCPINGVFLAIPADSLIKDTADEIEQKASKIARQFDTIQRTLDVRFPVFVIITKSDLINGFRDFFENIEDPQLQHQIMGWSNPSPLDEPFNPNFIDQQIDTIQNRLCRRRLALMQQLSTGERSTRPEIRQIDNLYAFPQAITKLAPRMARYLELIFSVGSQWSGKPLFFRGIYFTSSMQEGSALDQDLAQALGVSVEALPDGRAWRRDRAFFLRDLFMRKVFQEKGLVTRATNASRQHNRRKAVLLLSGIASVLILIGFTIYAAWSFNKNVGRLEQYTSIFVQDRDNIRYLEIVNEDAEYSGAKLCPGLEKDEITKCGFHLNFSRAINSWLDDKNKWLMGHFLGRRTIKTDTLRQAQIDLFNTTVLIPYIQTANAFLMQETDGDWSETSSKTKVFIRQLALKASEKFQPNPDSQDYFLDAFSLYLDQKAGSDEEADWKAYWAKDDKKEKPSNREILQSLMTPEAVASLRKTQTWAQMDEVIDRCLDSYIAYWSDSQRLLNTQGQANAADLLTLKKSLGQFDSSEQTLLDNAFNPLRWDENFGAVKQAYEKIEQWKAGNPSGFSLIERFELEQQTQKQQISDRFNSLLMLFDQYQEEKKPLTEALQKIQSEAGEKIKLPDASSIGAMASKQDQWYHKILNKQNELIDTIAQQQSLKEDYSYLQAILWRQWPSRQVPLYAIRYQQYQQIDAIRRQGDLTAMVNACAALENNRTLRKEMPEDLSRPAGDRFAKMFDYTNYALAYTAVDEAPASQASFTELIEKDPENDWQTFRHYNPAVLKSKIQAWHQLKVYAAQYPDIQAQYDKKDPVFEDYLYGDGKQRGFRDFWTVDYPQQIIAGLFEIPADSWITYKQWLESIRSREVSTTLVDIHLKITQAMGLSGDKDTAAWLNTIDEQELSKEIRNVLRSWIELPDDILQARDTLLQTSAGDWVDDNCYFTLSSLSETLKGFYYTELACRSFERLASDLQAKRNDAVSAAMNASNKFPLSRQGQSQLSIQELQDLQEKIDMLSFNQEWKRGTLGQAKAIELFVDEGLSASLKNISKYIQSQQERMNQSLERILSEKLPEDQSRQIAQIHQLLNCLPKQGQRYRCELSVVGKPGYKTFGIDHIDNDVITGFKILYEGSKAIQLDTNPESAQTLKIGRYAFPWQSFNIEFHQWPAEESKMGQIPKPYTGTWSFLQMLLDSTDQKLFENGIVRLRCNPKLGPTEFGGKDSVYLQLKFFIEDQEKEIVWPELNEWPK